MNRLDHGLDFRSACDIHFVVLPVVSSTVGVECLGEEIFDERVSILSSVVQEGDGTQRGCGVKCGAVLIQRPIDPKRITHWINIGIRHPFLNGAWPASDVNDLYRLG